MSTEQRPNAEQTSRYRVDVQHTPRTNHRRQSPHDRLEMLKTCKANADGDPVLQSAQPPEETVPARRGTASHAAAGIPAVLKTMEFGWHQMGVVRSFKTYLNINQKDGFDCPSCAWTSPDGKRHHAEFCENGAKAVASEATTRRVTPEFFRRWSVEQLATQSDYWLNQQGRLTHPMVLRWGQRHYEPIEWTDAFALIAEELNRLGSPDEASFYTSGKITNEPAFLYQLFARQFGTNNLPDCSKHVSGRVRHRAVRNDRRRQGDSHTEGLRARGYDPPDRHEPRHQSPPHDDITLACQAEGSKDDCN